MAYGLAQGIRSPQYCSKANLGTRIAAEATAQVDVGGGSAGLREEGEQGEQRDRRDLSHDSAKNRNRNRRVGDWGQK